MGSFWFVNCAAEAEESPDDSSDEELLLNSFLINAGLLPPNGIFWEGSASIDSCTGTTLEAGAYCGTLIAQGQQIQQDSFEKNFYLSQDSFGAGIVTAKLFLLAPHFNVVPTGYLYQTQGTLTAGQTSQTNILTLTQTAVLRNDNTGYTITFTSIRFEDRPVEGLVGAATVVLQSDAVNGDAVLVYKITAKKIL